MMDEFAEKRGMVKMLLDMLKNHASKEVSDGMAPPPGKGIAIEKVSVMPKDKMPMEPEKMADGGMPAESDEPERMMMPPEQSADGSADEEALKNMAAGDEEDHEMEDQDEGNNQFMFSAFLGRKKKK